MGKWGKWTIAGIVGALVGFAGAGTAAAMAPEIPYGVTVLGIGIGGKSRAAAAATLREKIPADRPLIVKIENRRAAIRPDQVGLAVDIEATVARAASRSNLFKSVEPVVTVDQKRLVAALKPAADGQGKLATLPAIRFAGLHPQPIYPVPGKGLNPDRTAQIAVRAWLREPEAVVPIVDVIPVSTAAEVDRLLAELAEPAVAAKVTVDTDKGELILTPEQIAASLVIDSDGTGKLTPHIDEPALRAAMKTELEDVETPPRTATVGDGRILVSEGGTVMDTARLASDLMPVLRDPQPRSVRAAFTAAPQVTGPEIVGLGIRERVSTFTTYFEGGLDSPRTNNIIMGAKEIDGAIVKPGEVFSLNGYTGPRGYEQGYKDAPIIANGRLMPGVGGGLSQFTTTLFNAVYYAGLEDVEHRPHTLYFPAYPSVIEATIFYPSLDMKFRNNTPYGILIDTSYTEDSITVSLWSTKIYDSVTTEWGPRRDIVEPKAMSVAAGPGCIARPGSQGFAQDAWRVIHNDGKVTAREKFTWRYDAEPRVTCG